MLNIPHGPITPRDSNALCRPASAAIDPVVEPRGLLRCNVSARPKAASATLTAG